ncbi:MAG: hypothetical protein ABW352_13070 [Polyangiales bacterium]
MMRRTGVWIGALGLMLAATGCANEGSQTDEADESRVLGDVLLGLALPDGSNVSVVDYVISRSGSEVRSGTMQVGADGRASVSISGLTAGAGYQVKLTATRTTGAACQGEATFTVIDNQTVDVNVVLQCDDLSGDGNVTITGSFNLCPKLGATSASPLTVAIGASTSLTVAASDKDGDPVSYAWTATDGSFSAPTGASTQYICASAGEKELKVSFTDGAQRGCTKSAVVKITCVGNLDAGVDSGVDSGTDAGVDSGVDAGGTVSSKASYVVPTLTPGVQTKAILTVGDSANLKPDGTTPYRMVGIPDGMGAFDNNDGTFTLLSNHELGNTAGIVRAHGSRGAFVSKWIVRKSDLRVLDGQDLIQTVQIYNPSTSSYTGGTYEFNRFCSADLADQGAWYDAASNTGFQGRMFLNGEEGGAGRAFAHGLDGVSWELPRVGKQAWENVVGAPGSGLKTVVIGTDDTTPGQVFVYIGTKTNSGSAIERAGLANGALYGVRVPGVLAEVNATAIPTGPFELAPLGDVSALSLAQLDAAANTAAVTTFLRPEDGAFDPSAPNDYYFVTTNGATANSRLWRLRFTDIKQPELGGTITALLTGGEGHRMLDNIGIDGKGHIVAVEDVGGNARIGKVWRYTIATGAFVEIAAHDEALFTSGAPGFLTQDEEASGIIDASGILGAGWWLLDTQAHYGAGDAELVEGGQFQALFDPGTAN